MKTGTDNEFLYRGNSISGNINLLTLIVCVLTVGIAGTSTIPASAEIQSMFFNSISQISSAFAY